jgi:Anti-sigma-K factor rskA/Putative zinc-finger
MSNDDIHGLSGAYAVDAVDDAERARFEAHLMGCSECQDEVDSLRSAAGELAVEALTSPPPSLRARVLGDISSARPLPPHVAPAEGSAPEQVADHATPAPASLESKRDQSPRRARARSWLVGVAAAAVLAAGGLAWHPWSPSTRAVQLTATQQVLAAKDAQRFEQQIGGATATIVRSPGLKKAVILAANLPAPQAGKVYELWLQQGKTLVRAGFLPAGSVNTVLLEGDAGTASGAGITLEPAGGSSTPSLPPVALISFT